MTKSEAINNIIEVFNDVTKTDDEILKAVKRLEIVLLNLKIENARISGNTGIEPIANELNKNCDWCGQKLDWRKENDK